MLNQNSDKGVWNEVEVMCHKEFILESFRTALWLQGWTV
jgi:hypothetical protein